MAGYFADDMDLSTLAWNIQNRGGSLGMAQRRGSNFVVPGRDGTKYVDKPLDEKVEQYDFWVQGSESDGSMPVSGTEKTKVRDNIDALLRVFGQGKLFEWARVETGAAYGAKNMLLNPSLEKFGGKDITRENQIQNPSGEYSSGLHPLRRNFARNPSMEGGTKSGAIRTNYAVNPRFIAEGKERVFRRNILPNPSIEAELRPWRAGNNSAVSRSKNKFTGWPTAGSWSLRLDVSAAGAATGIANSGHFPVTAALSYALRLRFYFVSVGGSTRTITGVFRWKNKAGAVLSTSSVAVTLQPSATVGSLTGTVTAPANAVSAVLSLQTSAGSTNGDVYYFDEIMVEQAASVGSYFDGDFDEASGYRFRWSDETGSGASEAYVVEPYGWRSPLPTLGRMGLSVDAARFGRMSARMEVLASMALGNRVIEQTFRGGSQIDPNTVFSAQLSWQLFSSITATRTISAIVNCYDSDGNSLGVAYNAGTTTAMTAVSVTGVPGEWIAISMENIQTRPKTARVTISITNGEAWSIGDGGFFDACLVETASALGTYFDGSTRDDETFSYEWDDDPHVSNSNVVGYTVDDWTVVNGLGYRSNNGRTEADACLRIEAARGGSATPYAYASVYDIRSGRTHTASAYVRLSTGSLNCRMGYSLDNGRNWTWASNTLVSTTYTRISQTVSGLTDDNLAKFLIAVQVNATLPDGSYADVDDIQFEANVAATPYFDGDSGKRYGWEDNQWDSASIHYGMKADGWSAYGAGRPYVERVVPTTADTGGGTYAVQVTSTQTGDFGVTFAQDGIDDDLVYSFGIDVNPPANGTVRCGITYFDGQSNQVGETFTDTAVTTAAGWQHCVHVGSAVPSTAVTAAPWAVFRSGTAGQVLLLDKAIFGFGSTTTYADGDSGGGWEWVNDPIVSESRQYTSVPDNWRADGGTFVRDSGTWSTDRTYSGLYTVTAGSGTFRIYSLRKDATRQEARRFRIESGKQCTFAVDARAGSATRVRLGFLPRVWTGWGWKASTTPTTTGTPVSLATNVAQRVSITADPAATGDATHFIPFIEFQASGGGIPAVGAVLRVDSALLSYDVTANTYFDGEDTNVRWDGDADLSASTVRGPARRCFAEVRSAIDMSTVDAEMARFALEIVIPSGLYEDPIVRTQKYTIGRPGSILTLTHLDGMDAFINDGVFEVNGPFNDLRITDVGSGEWIAFDMREQDDQSIIIDSSDWTVKNKRGVSLMDKVTRSAGAVYMLKLTLPNGESAPRLQFDAKSIGRGAWINVTARRKFFNA